MTDPARGEMSDEGAQRPQRSGRWRFPGAGDLGRRLRTADRGRRPADGGDGPPPPAGGSSGARRFNTVSLLLWVGLLVVMGALLLSTSRSPAPRSLSYSDFLSQVAGGQVTSVQINQSSGVVTGQLANRQTFTSQGAPGGMPAPDLALLAEHHVSRNYAAPSSTLWPTLLAWVLPIGLLVVLWLWMSRRIQGQVGGLAGWSKSGAKVHTEQRPDTTFADIAGYEGVKQEVAEVVQFLKDPERFTSIGARVPKGLLLVGPPGTGKTLFARAVAGEARVPFIAITGSEFMEMFVGVGAARVRDLFKTAREGKPSIIFVDEIDAIGRKRGTGLGGGHDEREQTLNQLLAEMDGFEGAEGIIVIAATNRPDILDPALLRAGRFDREVVIPLPTLEERRAILAVHCRGKRVAASADLEFLARGTPGMSGADLENLVNEAALIAVRRGSAQIEGGDLEAAHDRVLLGLRRTSLVLSPDVKHVVAYHEAGHAVLAELLPEADRVHKVTILPTGLALGNTQQLPDEERVIEQRPRLDDALAVRLGGRAAEELVFAVASTGAQDDLTAATALAGRMVREWGMSAELGNMSWGPRGPVFLGEELLHTRDYSDETASVIDREVARILGEQAQRARQVLDHHRRALDAVAGALEQEETLDGETVAHLVAVAESGPGGAAAPGVAAVNGPPGSEGRHPRRASQRRSGAVVSAATPPGGRTTGLPGAASG